MTVRENLNVMSWIFEWLGSDLSLQSPESDLLRTQIIVRLISGCVYLGNSDDFSAQSHFSASRIATIIFHLKSG